MSDSDEIHLKAFKYIQIHLSRCPRLQDLSFLGAFGAAFAAFASSDIHPGVEEAAERDPGFRGALSTVGPVVTPQVAGAPKEDFLGR